MLRDRKSSVQRFRLCVVAECGQVGRSRRTLSSAATLTLRPTLVNVPRTHRRWLRCRRSGFPSIRKSHRFSGPRPAGIGPTVLNPDDRAIVVTDVPCTSHVFGGDGRSNRSTLSRNSDRCLLLKTHSKETRSLWRAVLICTPARLSRPPRPTDGRASHLSGRCVSTSGAVRGSCPRTWSGLASGRRPRRRPPVDIPLYNIHFYYNITLF